MIWIALPAGWCVYDQLTEPKKYINLIPNVSHLSFVVVLLLRLYIVAGCFNKFQWSRRLEKMHSTGTGARSTNIQHTIIYYEEKQSLHKMLTWIFNQPYSLSVATIKPQRGTMMGYVLKAQSCSGTLISLDILKSHTISRCC